MKKLIFFIPLFCNMVSEQAFFAHLSSLVIFMLSLPMARGGVQPNAKVVPVGTSEDRGCHYFLQNANHPSLVLISHNVC